jgi:hypothetical protein
VTRRSRWIALSALAAVAAGVAGDRTASAQLPSADALRALQARTLVTELDVAGAEEILAEVDPNDPVAALERARARLWRKDCEGASAILGRPDLEGSKEAAPLVAVARGCLRAMAGTVLVEDEARGVSIRFQDDADRPLAPLLADVAARTRDVLAKDLGVTLPRPIHVEVVRDQHTLAAMTGLPLEAAATTGTVAVAKWGRVIMLSPRAASGGYPWLDTLSHELVHLALTRGSRDKAPLWLQEGVAKVEEARWRAPEPFDDRPPADDLAGWGLAANIGPPIDAIGPSIAMLPSAEESMVTYAKVQSFIGFFQREAGAEALPKLITAMRDAPRPDDLGAAVEAASGAPFGTWKSRWETSVREHADDLPANQRPGAPPSPSFAEVRRRVRLGELLEARDHHEAARKQRAAAIALAPGDGRVRAGLTASLLALGEHDAAREVIAPVEVVRHPTGRWWSLRAALLDEGAEQAAAAAVARDPLAPPVACVELEPPERPADPVRATICDMARAAPRDGQPGGSSIPQTTP